jgi:hypothetical protein
VIGCSSSSSGAYPKIALDRRFAATTVPVGVNTSIPWGTAAMADASPPKCPRTAAASSLPDDESHAHDPWEVRLAGSSGLRSDGVGAYADRMYEVVFMVPYRNSYYDGP